jgi:diguanylate cyclase (GGDEF)-like protein
VQVSEKIVGIATSIAMIFSGAVLTYSALKVNAIPKSALIAAIITISLAVVRLAIALQEARGAATNLELSRRDELTGLANRRYFINELEALGTTPATVLLLDLNGFKPVNDLLGHEAGDTLLRHISMRFSRVIPHGSTLARLGGDEFGVLIPGSPSQGLEVALALSSTLTYPFTINGHEVNAGVSIGRVTNDGSGELMQRADAAMYEAKRAGGGTVLWQP